MANRGTVFTGSELIASRSKITKDLPLLGLKEFQPSHSWLEGKQIQKNLEERYDLLKEERIEKISSLTTAEWIPSLRKAKVTKKIGKIWETFGYHQDDEDWLLPEEALYLLETNALELYFGNVRLSVERSYTILLDPSNGFSLEEYRTYSFLNRNGYKTVRHSRDVTVTRYEKQICLDQHTMSKRSVPPRNDIVHIDEDVVSSHGSLDSEIDVVLLNDEPMVIDLRDDLPLDDVPEKLKTDSTKASLPNDLLESNFQVESLKVEKKAANDDVILIDDDECEVRAKEENLRSSEDSSDSGDVVFVPPARCPINWGTYVSADKFLSVSFIDLCEEEICLKVEDGEDEKSFLKEETNGCVHSSIEKNNKNNLINKSRFEILNSFPSAAKHGLPLLRCPDFLLIPKNIVPKYSEYRVNLNVRPIQRVQYRPRPYYRRPFTHSPMYQPRFQPPAIDNSIIRQAHEMQAMAVGMMQVATTLISSMHPQTSNSLLPQVGGPLMQALNVVQQVSTYSRKLQSNCFPQNNFTTRPIVPNIGPPNGRFCNNGTNFRFEKRFCGESRVVARRGGFNQPRYFQNNNRYFNMQRKEGSALYESRPTNKFEVVVIDSDDDVEEEEEEIQVQNVIDVQESNVKDENSSQEPPSKKFKPCDILDGGIDKSIEHVKQEMAKVDSNLSIINCSSVKNECSSQDVDVALPETSVKTETLASSEKTVVTEPPNAISTDIKSLLTEDDKSTLVSVVELEASLSTPKLEVDSGTLEVEKIDTCCSELEIEKSATPNSVVELETSATPNSVVEVKYEEEFVKETSEAPVNCSEEMEIEQIINVEPTKACVSENMTEVTSWVQFKKQLEPATEINISPVLKQEECTSYESVYSSLQIFKKPDFSELNGSALKISFDLFLPHVHFKKSMKMLPNYRIIVLSLDDQIPTPAELAVLQKDYQDGIPFLFAIVMEESIAFYLFNSVELPSDKD